MMTGFKSARLDKNYTLMPAEIRPENEANEGEK